MTKINLDQCDLRLIDPDGDPPVWQCLRCARMIRTRAKRPRASCQYQPPGMLQRISSAAHAGWDWVSHGMPRRSGEDAASIQQVCYSCEWLIGGVCQKCGCFVSPKIQMATESCPIGKWGPTAPVHRHVSHRTGPVRVAIATPVFCCGGTERWMMSLAKWLEPTKARVTKIIVTHPGGLDRIVAAWLPDGIEITESTAIDDDGTFDCLITWGQINLVQLTARIGCPMIDCQHGAENTPTWQEPLVAAASRASQQLGTTLVAVSECCRENFAPAIRDRISVIANGAEPDRLATTETTDATRARAGVPSDAKLVLFLGRVSSEKNAQAIVDAIAFLPHDWHACIVGPQNSGLQRVGPRVHLIPAQRDIGNWLAIADVVCQPSYHESHCLAINEAWLAGVPVVSCDYPVNVAFEGRHGKLMWLVPVGTTPMVLADAILSADRADPRVAHAQSVAREHYTAEIMGRRWSDLIWSLCRK